MKSILNQTQMDFLIQNLKNTNFTNVRVVQDKILADYHGTIKEYTKDKYGKTISTDIFEGVNDVEIIDIHPVLLNQVNDWGCDQDIAIMDKIEYKRYIAN